jgi:WD40 repeat protein
MANAWVEPLPKSAVARLGTTAFRPGTGGLTPGLPRLGVHQVMFQGDDMLVSLGGQQVRFWNPATGEELFRVRPIKTDRHQLREAHLFDEGHRFLLPATRDVGPLQPVVALWDLPAQQVPRQVKFEKHPRASADFLGPSAVAAGGKAYAQQDFRGNAWFWNADGQPLGAIQATAPLALFLLPDGKSALTVEGRTRIRLWDITTGAVRSTAGDNLSMATASAVSPDGTWLATLGMKSDRSPEAFVRLWQIASGTLVRELPWPGVPAQPPAGPRLAFSADGNVLVGETPDAEDLHFCRWNLPDGEPFTWRASQRGTLVRALAVDASGGRVAIASEGTLRLFDTTKGREFVPADAHANPIQAVRFAAGDTLISVDDTGEVRTWDGKGQLKSSEQARRVPDREPPPVIEAQSVILWRGTPDEVTIEVNVAELMKTDLARLTPLSFALSPDGRSLALGFQSKPPCGEAVGTVAVFDLEQKKLRWQGPMLQCAPATLCFSPDSKRLAIGTVEVILTNAANGAPLGTTFRGHRGLVTALAFRPDGLRLASGSTDSTVLIWDCQP